MSSIAVQSRLVFEVFWTSTCDPRVSGNKAPWGAINRLQEEGRIREDCPLPDRWRYSVLCPPEELPASVQELVEAYDERMQRLFAA